MNNELTISKRAQPAKPFTQDGSRYFVTTLKLCESHPVRMCVQVGGDSPATFFDRQDGVVLSMRDVKARLSHPRALDDKTGREGHDAFEEVTVECSDSSVCNFVSFTDEDGEANLIPADKVMLLESIRYEDEFEDEVPDKDKGE